MPVTTTGSQASEFFSNLGGVDFTVGLNLSVNTSPVRQHLQALQRAGHVGVARRPCRGQPEPSVADLDYTLCSETIEPLVLFLLIRLRWANSLPLDRLFGHEEPRHLFRESPPSHRGDPHRAAFSHC
jgi:hypothetical protein